MDIHIDRDTIVDKRTGETASPTEFLETLRAIERDLVRADEDIAGMQDDLKAARAAREQLVLQLRAAVREGQVLPLFEGPEGDEAP
jgi:predicted Ser/Thr protein kinase